MPAGGIDLDALLGEKLRRERLGSGTGSVQARQLPGSGFPIEDEQIAAEAGLHRLDHGQHGVGGDGGVHRRSAAAPESARLPTKPASGWSRRCPAALITIERP